MSKTDLPPPPPKPKFYELVVVHDKIAYVSGGVSRLADGVIGGYLRDDDDLDVAKGSRARVDAPLPQRAAGRTRQPRSGSNGSLSIRGFMCAAPEFTRHPEVLDAASELLLEMLGERGQHARSALGVSAHPWGRPYRNRNDRGSGLSPPCP